MLILPKLNNIQTLIKAYIIACFLFVLSMLAVQYNDDHHVLHVRELRIRPLKTKTLVDATNDNGIKSMLNLTMSISKYMPLLNPNHQVPFNSMKMPNLTCDGYIPSTYAQSIIDRNPFKIVNQTELCDAEYGCGLLHIWKMHPVPMCEPKPQSALERLRSYVIGNLDTHSTTLTCYNFNNTHQPPATLPHTVCESTNLVFDFSKLVHAPCLKYRPGYFCKKPTYYNYNESALVGNCRRSSTFDLNIFSKDFGKDIFSSFNTFEEINYKEKKMEYFDGITIFVSREQDEHVNMFHSMTDFFATYLMIEMFQLDSSEVQIVILDDHYDGPFDFLWNSVFSMKRPMMKASQFNNQTVRFERAIFQHSGYGTQLLSHILDFNVSNPKMCNSPVSLINSFSNRILHALNIKKREVKLKDVVRVLFISRKPYSTNGIEHKFMARQISNEDDVIARLKQHPLCNSTLLEIDKIDFAHLTLTEQIKKVHNSDLLIGYHGAGLTHALWLPEGTSAVMEIWKAVKLKSWRCFEQFTLWKGNSYNLWINTEPRSTRVDKLGDYMRINPENFYQNFDSLLKTLMTERTKKLS